MLHAVLATSRGVGHGACWHQHARERNQVCLLTDQVKILENPLRARADQFADGCLPARGLSPSASCLARRAPGARALARTRVQSISLIRVLRRRERWWVRSGMARTFAGRPGDLAIPEAPRLAVAPLPAVMEMLTALIVEVIERRYGVRYHRNHVRRLLAQCGWSCQKPERRARERDEQAIARWKRSTWPRATKTPFGWGPTSSS